ncbi:MAG: CapA family protein [Nitrospirae bacterium]|nr:CapA family protein [Nitrospirota bacterium]
MRPASVGLGLLVVTAWVVPLDSTTPANTRSSESKLIFVGDMLLSRGVDQEIRMWGGASPWEDLAGFFADADWAVGNLAGAVGEQARCSGKSRARESLCFATPENHLGLLRAAGLGAVGIENNHASDLGPRGRDETVRALRQAGVYPLTFVGSPYFRRIGNKVVSLIALDLTQPDSRAGSAALDAAVRHKLRLSRRLSHWTIAYVHWGSELLDWPDARQVSQARWLIEHGADVVIGHHPHVVQQATCVSGRPVFYSLGNHLFDQRYPASKAGLIADCRISDDWMRCGSVATRAKPGSFFPRLDFPEHHPGSRAELQSTLDCPVRARSPITVAGYELLPTYQDTTFSSGELVIEAQERGSPRWAEGTRNLLSLDALPSTKEGGEELLLLLHSAVSDLDGDSAPRPAVYRLMPGGPTAVWRGTALAWPLLDATVLGTPENGYFLCALHRGDSFLARGPGRERVRTQAYAWNGFGFKASSGPGEARLCEENFSKPFTAKN